MLVYDKNVEDEYYSAIENRDTAIMKRDKKIKEQEEELSEKDSQIRSLALALKDKGMTNGQISVLIGVDAERLERIIG